MTLLPINQCESLFILVLLFTPSIWSVLTFRTILPVPIPPVHSHLLIHHTVIVLNSRSSFPIYPLITRAPLLRKLHALPSNTLNASLDPTTIGTIFDYISFDLLYLVLNCLRNRFEFKYGDNLWLYLVFMQYYIICTLSLFT